MAGHAPAERQKKDLDDMLSRINALEAVASGEYQKGVARVLRALTEGQMRSVDEFEHLKKAIDLLTVELFKTRDAAGRS